MIQIYERHISIVNRLVKAIRYNNVQLDCQINGLDDNCCPDIVIQEDNHDDNLCNLPLSQRRNRPIHDRF
jgi:hypothetical protein